MAKGEKKAKVPKKVGGVKVPKDLRKSAKSALRLAQNPIAREILSAALVAGAAALAKRKGEKAAPAQPKTQPVDIGNLIAQGVAAFVSGLGKPPEKTAEESEKPAEPKARPTRGAKPLH